MPSSKEPKIGIDSLYHFDLGYSSLTTKVLWREWNDMPTVFKTAALGFLVQRFSQMTPLLMKEFHDKWAGGGL